MRIRCAQCGVALTTDLEEREETEFEPTAEDGADLLPEGVWYLTDGEAMKDTTGDYVVNIKSCMNLMNNVVGGRLNGCCGLDGCDGINQTCINVHEVATKRSDCWMPHAIYFNSERIKIEKS